LFSLGGRVRADADAPNFVEAHNYVGVVLLKLGKVQEAIAHFSEAVRLKPDYAEARQNLNIALETSK
jgi:tetratricopeptide (TPR) repeat protein